MVSKNIRIKFDRNLKISNQNLCPTFTQLPNFVDPSGNLNFDGKAVMHAHGVNFCSGNSYQINMAELCLLGELGKGQYGIVHLVHHKPTNVVMAMKEIRLELDSSKLKQILMELDVLHLSHSDHIVEFYGAFFIESGIFYCMEYMDAGSLDLLYPYNGGVPEIILVGISYSVVKGLLFLKQELKIIHRDIKPTNILANLKGQIKLCDFGVSGQLIQSLANTNIGCRSYMAPERITMISNVAYSTASDVWSLGVTLLEIGLGAYPYPPQHFDSIFAQINFIVNENSPTLPTNQFSPEAISFVQNCLQKEPSARPTYSQMLNHPFLIHYTPDQFSFHIAKWVESALAWNKQKVTATSHS